MRELSLFSGAGGGLLATKHLLGWECVGYVEIESYCQEVLKARIADGLLDAAPIFSDIRKFISEGYAEAYQGMVDVVTGGFPCQDISCTGKGAGITGERSGLWKSMVEVVRQVRPRYVLVENSPMLTIRGLGTVLGDLAAMGFDAEWGVLSGENANAPQRRERCWILAHSKISNEQRDLLGQSGIRGTQTQYRGFCSDKGGVGSWDRTLEPKPRMVRVADGMADRMDRSHAIGNGQISAVVELAWKILSGEQ